MRSTSNPAAGTAMVQHVRTDVMHLATTDQLRFGDNGTALCGRSTRFMDDTGVRDQNLTLGHPAGHCAECWQHASSLLTAAQILAEELASLPQLRARLATLTRPQDAVWARDVARIIARIERDAAARIAMGPVTLEPYASDDTTAEGWWGVNRSTGDAVFVTRDHDKWLLASEVDRPWVAWLWVGWEDGSKLSQRHPGYGVRYATAAEALHATKRVCADYYRRLGGDHADRWL